MDSNLNAGLAFLADNGLNLAAILPVDDLPSEMVERLGEHNIDVTSYRRLVLLGHGGRRFWEVFSTVDSEGDHPIDDFSARLAADFAASHLPEAAWLPIFPSALPLNLQWLGEMAGWSHPSPLGTGIHTQFGLWFAYRAAFLTATELPVLRQNPGSSPCLACSTRDCIGACPGRATAYAEQPDIQACVAYRLAPESSCVDRCLARLACPYAPEHRYTREQITYHYRYSYRSLRRYVDGNRAIHGA